MHRLLLAACFLVAVGIGWWTLGTTPEDVKELPPASPVGVEAALKPTESTTEPEPVVPTDPIVTKGFTPPPAKPMAEIRGRCLSEESGEAVVGAKVILSGFLGRGEEAEEQRLQGMPRWWKKDLWTRTDAEGHFEFHFEPPAHYEYDLSTHVDGYAGMRARYPSMEPNDVLDVGDVHLPIGVTVHALVKDSEEKPIGGALVDVRPARSTRPQGPRPRWRPNHSHKAMTNRKGELTFKRLLVPGEWHGEVEGHVIVHGQEFSVGRFEPESSTLIVVEPTPEPKTMSGIVTDERGEPLEDVRVSLSLKRSQPGPYLIPPEARSKEDGSFILLGVGEMLRAQPTLRARARGFVDFKNEETVDWGASGLHVIMKEQPGIEVLVVDGDTQEPVEKFGIHFFEYVPAAHQLRRAMGSKGILDIDQHPGGVLHVPGFSSKPHMLQVRPVDTSYAPSQWHIVELSHARDKRQIVRVFRRAQKTIRLVSSSGQPIAGSEVDVVLGIQGEVIDWRTQRASEGQPYRRPHFQAFKLAGGTTDAQGELKVRVSPEQECVLRALGPGHVPCILRKVTLKRDGQPFVIETPAGAAIGGKLSSRRFLDQIHCKDGKWTLGKAASAHPIGVFLTKPDSDSRVFPSTALCIPLQPDGSFFMNEVPPGDWDLKLHHWECLGDGSKSGTTISSVTPLAIVRSLRDGELRRISIGGSHLVMGSLEGTVTVNGSSPGPCSAHCEGLVSLPGGGQHEVTKFGLIVEESGRIRGDFLPGVYYLSIMLGSAESPKAIENTVPFTITSGEVVRRSFGMTTADLNVRVLAADGVTPVAGLKICAGIEHPNRVHRQVTTDSNGVAAFKTIAAGPCDLFCMPKHLQDDTALRKLAKEKGAVVNQEYILIEKLTLLKNTGEITITLPKSVGY